MATAKKQTSNVTTEEAKVLKISVFYKNCETKDGKKFKKWLTQTSDGKFYDVCFVLSAKTSMPKARSYVYVKESDMNWNRKNPKYPKLYIKDIQSVEPIESAPEDWTNYFEEA